MLAGLASSSLPSAPVPEVLYQISSVHEVGKLEKGGMAQKEQLWELSPKVPKDSKPGGNLRGPDTHDWLLGAYTDSLTSHTRQWELGCNQGHRLSEDGHRGTAT